jgi:hypothetical protein
VHGSKAFAASLSLAIATACVPEGPRTERSARGSEVPTPLGPPIEAVFVDDFERTELGPDYEALSDAWRIESGRLCARGARNRGVWLRRRLPVNARVELDAFALSEEGDLKVELWGDGQSGASGVSYSDATSYIAILGGWKNSQHVFARLDEHGDDRLAIPVDPRGSDLRARPVSRDRAYRFRFERRQGNMITWSVDGVVLVELVDDEPLSGRGHEHFAFNDWTAPVCFDNLRIEPL